LAGYGEEKEGKIKWRDLIDAIDSVFTTKGLEKDSAQEATGARVQTFYGRQGATKTDE
jgi:hypothetical protein